MRAGRDHEILCDKRGVIAVNLGADSCSEHEWGIQAMRLEFGMIDDEFGADRRRVRKTTSKFRWTDGMHKDKKWQGFWLIPFADCEQPVRLEYAFFNQETLWTGWSERDLGAFSIHTDQQKKLRRVFEAVESLDACLWLGGGGMFQNAGLVVGILSRIDRKWLDAWDRVDRERLALKQDAKATGIEVRLRAAGKEFFALSPRRQQDGSLRFWLNPLKQDCNQCGEFTVAELDQWIAGEGPIPKRQGRLR